MKRRFLSILLVMVMILAILPVTALADAADNIVVYAPTYRNNNSEVASISTAFGWTSGSVYGRLILSDVKLRGGEGSAVTIDGKSYTYGDFTNAGYYATKFKSFSEAKAFDDANHTFGYIAASANETYIRNGGGTNMTLTIPSGTIPLNVDKTYYLYLWVQNGAYFYPDNLICVIQVNGNNLKYSPGIVLSNEHRNYYDAAKFDDVPDTVTLPHYCTRSNWLMDDNNHWKRDCLYANCPNSNDKTVVEIGAHVFSGANDPDCNVCGYYKTAAAEKPETGDITNITLWTMMAMGGMVALWYQLEQRKREQY